MSTEKKIELTEDELTQIIVAAVHDARDNEVLPAQYIAKCKIDPVRNRFRYPD